MLSLPHINASKRLSKWHAQHHPRLRQFIQLYPRSPEVKAQLRQRYGDLIRLTW